MLTKNKRIWVLALLLVVMAPVLLFTVFLVKQKYIQYQVQEQLEKVFLNTISTSTSEIKWVKEGKEAEINGRLFDVKSFTSNGSNITLIGLYDDAEHELKKEFTGLLKEKKGDTAPLNQLVLKFLFYPAINKNNLYTAAINNTAVAITYAAYSENTLAQYADVTTPPPNI